MSKWLAPIHFDTNDKRLLYARAGIADYWIVDIDDRCVHVYREPRNGDYSIHRIVDASGTISPLAHPAANVRVADMMM